MGLAHVSASRELLDFFLSLSFPSAGLPLHGLHTLDWGSPDGPVETFLL